MGIKVSKKGGGGHFERGGGRPLFPLNPPLPSSSTKGGMHVNAPGECTRKGLIIFSHMYFSRHFVVYN